MGKQVSDFSFNLSELTQTVIRLKERQGADPKEFEAKKSEIKSGIISQKSQELMDEWLAQLRREGEIAIEEGFVE